ncbi:MAG TPA: family 20 glycosylhydrolase [Ignavibacteriaceae bacterium]|nr:family 20 glycosylhydrolase [Ignavibacteriaceae bacterium]
MKSLFNYILILFLFSSFSNLSAEGNMKLNLMPMPANVTVNEGKFLLTPSFTIAIQGKASDDFYSYATRVLRRISGRTGLFFPQDFLTKENNPISAPMIINCERLGKVELNEDESYTLTVTNSDIKLNATTDIGAMRGLETLVQLLQSDESGYYIPAVTIEDAPRFRWRGLMIDVSRHFMPLDVIKRNLDAMASVKMNVFHWHLSDDQGIRVEVKSLPKLNQLGSDGMYFTHEQIKEILAYAKARGIRVIPEFDIPGHSTAFLTAFPQLASAPGPYKIERNWGIFDPTFNPTIEATYKFFDTFFKEMCALFDDPYMHIGGDENNGKQWNNNKEIQTFMKKHNIPDNHGLQAYFNQRISKIITKYGKKMVGWDEIQHPNLPTNIVIQSWRGQKGLVDAATKGYQVILSNGYYIDLIQPTDFHYLNDPIPFNSPLTDEQKKFVLGGEVTSWAELVTPENIDSRIWPRTAAVAERFWSPQTVNDVEEMHRRLECVSFMLEDFGLLHIKNQPMMLRRLTNNNDTAPLKTLIDVIEPVKLYARHSQGVKYTSYSPYTRVVDAALPDVKIKRTLDKLIEKYIADKDEQSYNQLKDLFTTWQNNHSKFVELIKVSPILKEMEPLSNNLAIISKRGLEAIEYIKKGDNPLDNWFGDVQKDLDAAKKPYGQTEIMIIPQIEKLVNKVKV